MVGLGPTIFQVFSVPIKLQALRAWMLTGTISFVVTCLAETVEAKKMLLLHLLKLDEQ